MAATLMEKIRFFVFVTVACILFVLTGVSSSESAVNGMLRTHTNGSQQILNLWGTNYEMGYAHGYLMADKIRDLFEHYIVVRVAGGASGYAAFLSKANSQFVWQPSLADKDAGEITGMMNGMVASGKSLYVPTLGRNINAGDIKAMNLQEQFYFGCSSFGVWGNATNGGETILARNLDFYWDREGNNANYQMTIVYEPSGIGKTKFASFAWPGSVGVYSGMNEFGITVMANTGNLGHTFSGPFSPVVEVYRTVLETTNSFNFSTQPKQVIGTYHEKPPEIIQIGAPSNKVTEAPVYYIEQSSIDVKRSPINGNYYILATNYFLDINLYTTPYWEYSQRYNTINAGLLGLLSNGGKVDSKEAWGVLGLPKVADSIAPTLTSIVIRPNSMQFDLSFAKVVNGVFTSATKISPETYLWSDLFPALKLVARDDSYSTAANTIFNATGGVLGNDTAPEGFYVEKMSDPLHGEVTFNADGIFRYTPDSNYSGVDSFKYRVTNGTNNSNDATVSITVSPALGLSSLALSPTSVTGGTSSTGTVTLSGTATNPVIVTLTSSDSTVIVPGSVSVTTSKTFTITTPKVTSNKIITITAEYNGVKLTKTLTVTPSATTPALSSLTLYPTSVKGGTSSTGTVRLTSAATSDVWVTLKCYNSYNSSTTSVPARVPVNVKILKGASSASFTITTSSVYSNKYVTISSSYNGVTKTAPLTVRRY